MDNAPLRRGKTTIHEKWDNNTAILSGDTMMIQAYQLILKTPDKYLREVLSLFSDTAVSVCEGQQFDMDFEITNNVTLQKLKKQILKKKQQFFLVFKSWSYYRWSFTCRCK